MQKEPENKSDQIPEFLKNERLRKLTLILFGAVVLCTAFSFMLNAVFGLIILVLSIITLVVAYDGLKQIASDTSEYISDLSYRIKRGEQEALIKMPIGILFYDDHERIEWYNPYMQRYFSRKDILGKSLSEVDEELADQLKSHRDEKKATEVKLHGKSYSFIVQKDINAVFLMDVSYYAAIKEQYEDSRIVLGQLFLDNYDEVTKVMNDKDLSNLDNFITNTLSDWAREFEIFLKRVDDDHFFILAYTGALKKLEEEKFKILDVIRERTSKRNSPLTLSVGIAYGGDDLAELSRLSQNNLDLALGRGGDQVVVKTRDKISYFGGSNRQVDKSTRVKARVKALALREIMITRDKFFVMGHKIADIDSFGAAIGIYCAARQLGKKAQIVIDEVNTTLRPLKECFTPENGYPDDMFIPSQLALDEIDSHTALIVVDTNRPSYTECPNLLNRAKAIVVFDHHRQCEDVVKNAVLSYTEPYASSTCEMIAEVLQYFDEDIKLSTQEADAIYAGILIDTNNFVSKTGVRTFEAAAYLRRCGAEVTRVRKMLRNDMDAYKARAEAVRHAEVFHNMFAISVCPADNIESPTVACAQAANELLNIIGIKASFVLTEYHDRIYISARSIDEINVQLVMERLGGGGHMNSAGAQLTGCTLEDAKRTIENTLDEMIREGDIK